MASSPQNKRREIFDPMRNKWVVASPEEKVRQSCIIYLVESCHFPVELIAIEKNLSEIPLIQTENGPPPDRRLDLLCYGPKLSFPLLIIECKAVPLQEKMLGQVWGYNAYVGAPFAALINENEIKFSWEERGERRFLDFIPPFQELVNACQK